MGTVLTWRPRGCRRQIRIVVLKPANDPLELSLPGIGQEPNSPLTRGDVGQKMNEGRNRGPSLSSNPGRCSWNPAVLVPAMHQFLRLCCHVAARCGVFAAP